MTTGSDARYHDGPFNNHSIPVFVVFSPGSPSWLRFSCMSDHTASSVPEHHAYGKDKVVLEISSQSATVEEENEGGRVAWLTILGTSVVGPLAGLVDLADGSLRSFFIQFCTLG